MKTKHSQKGPVPNLPYVRWGSNDGSRSLESKIKSVRRITIQPDEFWLFNSPTGTRVAEVGQPMRVIDFTDAEKAKIRKFLGVRELPSQGSAFSRFAVINGVAIVLLAIAVFWRYIRNPENRSPSED